MKIGILQTGRAPEQTMQQHGDYDQFFVTYLADRGFAFDTYPVLDGVFPDSPGAADGWLITGSRFGAYEDHPWIPPLEAFLRDAYDAAVPIVGICFGHQILAQALGGKVEKYAGGWSVGPQSYRSEMFGDQSIIAWHQDQVVERPADAQVVASSDFCENAMLLYGQKAFTIQSHPEFTAGFLKDLLATRGQVLPADIRSDAETRAQTPLTSDGFADQIVRFFEGKLRT